MQTRDIRQWLSIIVLSILITPLSAQSENRISCVAFVKDDSIMIRWVPASLPVWQSGIEHGYIIKKYTISRAGEFITDGLSNGKLVTPSPVRHTSSEKFDLLASSDSRASVVQEAIFGSDFLQPSDNFTAFRKSYEELEVRLGFALFMCDMSHVIANAAGLYYCDKEIIKGERYVYSISLANTPDGIQVEPAVIVVDADELTSLPPVTDIQAIFLDRTVKFRWPVTFFKGVYSAYVIEKSIDGKEFSPVTELPLVNISDQENPDHFIFTDSLDNNNQQVFYRVKGISPFGLSGPFSKILSGKGVPEFSSYASIDTAIVIENSRIMLKWRLSESENSLVSGISILRSDSYNGDYEPVNRKPLNPRIRTFTDDKPSQSNYYQIMLSGKDDLKSYSFPYFVQTEDNEPPVTPQDLSGNVDSAGVVSIIWKSNSEPDLLGYKVFRANSPEDEFIPLDREISNKNFCLDSINLNTLSREICYQVVAIDRNYNNSDYSTILVLTRPDTIPPSPAVISRIDYSNGKMIYSMEESPSSDVASYEMHMQNERDSIDVLVSTWKKLPEKAENEISATGILEYRLVTIDNKENRSEYRRKVYAHGFGTETIVLTADQSADGSIIILNWNVPADFIPLKTVIYRGEGDNPGGIYATIVNRSDSFEDENIEINTSYNYRIVLFNESEAISSGNLLFSPKSKKK